MERVMSGPDRLVKSQQRRKVVARSLADRERLVRMRASWIALDESEDWLDGIAIPMAGKLSS
jgi:hypothetical protein